MRISRTKIIIGLGICLIAGSVIIIRSLLTPEEERIRWVILGMADDFNGARAGGCVAPLADEFREERYDLGRDELRTILLRIFMGERDRKIGRFRWRVEVEPEEIAVEWPDDRDRERASINVSARFFPVEGPSDGAPVWEIVATGRMRMRDGEWKLVTGTYQTITGRRPF
ncbi:MAG: hypothetical protein ACE5GW_00505 [Planctomycetota bacterium]